MKRAIILLVSWISLSAQVGTTLTSVNEVAVQSGQVWNVKHISIGSITRLPICVVNGVTQVLSLYSIPNGYTFIGNALYPWNPSNWNGQQVIVTYPYQVGK